MSNRSAATPCDSMPLQTIPAPQRRGHLRGRARCWSVQTGWAASAAWRPLAVLAAAWGLAAAAPPNPAKVSAATNGCCRSRRGPHAGMAAYALSPIRARLRSRGFPLRSGSPVGAREPRRATHAAHSLSDARAGPILHRGTRAKRVLLSPPVQGYARSGSGAAADAALPSPDGRTNPESGARFFENSCTRNRKSRPKRRLFSLLDNIGGIFRFSNT